MIKGNFWTKLFLLFAIACSSSVFAAATETDMYSAMEEGFGKGAYVYYDYKGTIGVDGFRNKAWGTDNDLFDSGQSSYGLKNNEFAAESLTGLNPSTFYDVYVLAGGKVNSGANESWGVQVGFASGDYMLRTADIGDDSSLVKYNLGNYYNGSSYPYREASSINDACMYAVYVGSAQTDASGTLNVYAADSNGVTIGSVTGFRTWFDGFVVIPPKAANNPIPVDGAIDLEPTTDELLSWMPGFDPNNFTYENFYVYFGTSPENMQLMNSTATQDTVINVGATAYNSTYYWQVEQVEQDLNGNPVPGRAAGDPNNIFGPVWNFETIYFIPRIVDIARSDDKCRIGETVDLTVTYTTHQDYPVTNVSWYFNGSVIDAGANADYAQTIGTSESVLSVAINENTFGTYYCVVSNGAGSSADSDDVMFEPVTLWTWTGGAGTTNWSADLNWDLGVAPDMTNDVNIPTGIVDIDLAGDFHYSGFYNLSGDAQLVCPAGKRFGSGEHDDTVTKISDNSNLLLNTTSYCVLSRNYPAVFDQDGGEFNATINGGFLFSDNNLSSGVYNLNAGEMNVAFDVTSGSSSYYYQFMGKGPNSKDEFNVNGGSATFLNAGMSSRPVYIHRDSMITVNSGSLSFTDFDNVKVGYSYAGTATIEVNGGELDMIHTPLVVGDSASGTLEINGGLVNLDSTASDAIGLSVAPTTGSKGVVTQTAGDVVFNNTKLLLGGSSSADLSSAEYTISGGSLIGSGTLRLKVNSDFHVSGSVATAIEVQELIVENASAKLTFDLDENGCTMITVGADSENTTLTSGAQLANLNLVVNTLDSYVGGEVYNLIWAVNNGISGAESITMVNNSSQDFEIIVVDATNFGYASGELLQLRVIFDPASADFNADNKVDLVDFAMFAEAWLWEKE